MLLNASPARSMIYSKVYSAIFKWCNCLGIFMAIHNMWMDNRLFVFPYMVILNRRVCSNCIIMMKKGFSRIAYHSECCEIQAVIHIEHKIVSFVSDNLLCAGQCKHFHCFQLHMQRKTCMKLGVCCHFRQGIDSGPVQVTISSLFT